MVTSKALFFLSWCEDSDQFVGFEYFVLLCFFHCYNDGGQYKGFYRGSLYQIVHTFWSEKSTPVQCLKCSAGSQCYLIVERVVAQEAWTEMHRGNPCSVISVHRNLWRCRDVRFRKFHAWSMRTLFSCSKCFRLVAQTLYPHNSLRSLSLHFYVASYSKRTGTRLCSACVDQENENLISSPEANSGRWCHHDPCRFHRKYGFFQPGKNQGKLRCISHARMFSV